MRSCLVLLGALFLVLFLALWFALPAVAGALALNAFRAAGLSGTNVQVSVDSNPPPRLLFGHADTVHLTCTDGTLHDLHAGSVDVTLRGVSLLTREVETVDGTFDDVLVTAPDGTVATFAQVTIHGRATASDASLLLPLSDAAQLAQTRLRTDWGIAGTVTLTAPNRVTVTTAAGQRQSGTLLVKDGGLAVQPDLAALPTVSLITPGDGNPFTLTAMAIESDGLRLTGTIDVQSLLGAA